MVDLTRDAARAHPGAAARPGPRPVRAGLRRLARAARRRVPGRDRGRHPGPVPRLQERHRRPARGRRRRARRLPRRQARHRRRRRGPPPGPAGHPRPPRPQGRPAVRDPEHPALPAASASPTGNAPGSTRRSPPTNATTRSTSPGSAPSSSAPPTTHDTPPPDAPIAEKILASFPSCPIPEIARLGRTLQQWRAAFLAYFDTGGASNGGTEAINGLIELHRRIARGFRNRDNYRLRMLLIGGGLPLDPPQVRRATLPGVWFGARGRA